MFKPHSGIITPADETQLWRYMSIEKYLFLVAKSQLYFCRADKFRDPWEGVLPKLVSDEIKQVEFGDTVLQSISALQKTMFVNCWHAANHESAAMWDAYGHTNGAIAIMSTVGRLKHAISKASEGIHLGSVQYEDYENGNYNRGNTLKAYFTKRKSFSHEQEVRALFWWTGSRGKPLDFNQAPENFQISIDTHSLIERVFVSPTSGTWLVEIISDLTKHYCGKKVPVKRSSLYDPHVY